jgi:hypothetical protein
MRNIYYAGLYVYMCGVLARRTDGYLLLHTYYYIRVVRPNRLNIITHISIQHITCGMFIIVPPLTHYFHTYAEATRGDVSAEQTSTRIDMYYYCAVCPADANIYYASICGYYCCAQGAPL